MDSGGVGVRQVRLEQPVDLGRAGPAFDPRDVGALDEEDERRDLVDPERVAELRLRVVVDARDRGAVRVPCGRGVRAGFPSAAPDRTSVS